MNDINLHKVELSEIENLQIIAKKTFEETFSSVNTPEDMQQYIDEKLSIKQLEIEWNNENSEFYFAQKSQAIIGYLKLNQKNAQSESMPEDYLELERIYVLKDYFGQKVGKLLLEKAIGRGRELNKKYLWLGVWEYNEKAIMFYKHKGFEPFGNHTFILGKDVQNDILMKLKL